MEVSEGGDPSGVVWEMCGTKGGAPFDLTFKVDESGQGCRVLCEHALVEIDLFPGLSEPWVGEGWAGAHYVLSSADTGESFAGGTLLSGGTGATPVYSLVFTFSRFNSDFSIVLTWRLI